MSEGKTLDRLYELLPAIHRRRDAEQGYPLKALLHVITEQASVVQQDVDHLYDNWFIETCDEWVVPYIGDLVGYRPIVDGDSNAEIANTSDTRRNRAIIPRREIANTVYLRRRKGTLALLEELAWHVAGWPARAVEFSRLVSQTQAVNHIQLDRLRTVDVRNVATLELMDGRRLEPESRDRLGPVEAEHERLISHGAFDSNSHLADVRRINSHRTPGRYNLPNVGLFVFRLKSYEICKSQAGTAAARSPFFHFNPLGIDVPLFIKPTREDDPTHIAEEVNLPVPLRRRALIAPGSAEPKHASTDYYGEGKSLCIWTKHWDGNDDEITPVPATQVIPADLSNWEHYLPPRKFAAVDPVLGRIAFSRRHTPEQVWVSYHYAFSAEVGGGSYERQLSHPDGACIYRIGKDEMLKTIAEAKAAWQQESPPHAVFELSDNRTYKEHIKFELGEATSLQLRAANGCRPVIWSLDTASIVGRPNSRFISDGVCLAGASLYVEGELAELTIRHSTLVPGLALEHNCKPEKPDGPSIVVLSPTVALNIQHSIVGSIRVSLDEVRSEPIRIRLSDSILDATSTRQEAIGSDGCRLAHAVLTIERATVIGHVETHAIDLAENSILFGPVQVGRSQRGCMRFCYVEARYRDQERCSRTPRRYRCQPDLALQVLKQQDNWEDVSVDERQALQDIERLRVRPMFNSLRYGLPTYCQLAHPCPPEIKRGADDQSEIGVFHDLYEPQRRSLLEVRLAEFTPANSDAGIIFVT